jgi:membrane associated rhomboid family serine protease
MISYMKTQGLIFSKSLKSALIILGIMWLIHAIQVLLDMPLYQFGGLYPRTIFGLKGVFLSPWLHGSWGHLINNSIPLLVLLLMISFFYRKVAFNVIVSIYILTGIAVWIFGRPVFHIGASGVVYGLVSFVFWAGIFQKNVKSIVLALIVAVLYSGMFLGILPNEDGISWESHLIGGIIGIFVAFFMRDKMRRLYTERKKIFYDDDPPEYFFERDTFNRS